MSQKTSPIMSMSTSASIMIYLTLCQASTNTKPNGRLYNNGRVFYVCRQCKQKCDDFST